MNSIIRWMIILILCPSIIFAKNFYRIVIDPGHSYVDAKHGRKVGDKFKVNGEYVYAIVKDGTEKENIVYDFKRESEIPAGWEEFEYKDKQGVRHKVGFIEAALNLEVAKNLSRMLKNAKRGGKKICDVYLTRENQGYVCSSPYSLTKDLKARAKVALDKNADLFLSIHFNGGGGSYYLSIYHFKNDYKITYYKSEIKNAGSKPYLPDKAVIKITTM